MVIYTKLCISMMHSLNSLSILKQDEKKKLILGIKFKACYFKWIAVSANLRKNKDRFNNKINNLEGNSDYYFLNDVGVVNLDDKYSFFTIVAFRSKKIWLI